MNEKLQQLIEGKIDFEGQKVTEEIVRIALVASTLVSFLVGITVQSLQVTFGLFALSVVVLSLVVLPPWPIYNKHPVKWLPAKEAKA